MANFEVLSLDPTTPQIRAPGAGDGYSVPRDMTLEAGTTLTAPTVNATTVDATNVEVTNIKAKDGTAAASIADSTGVVSLSANPVLSGGTANGVLYLNGSKVATSGSAITYNGTTFGVDSAAVFNDSGADVDFRIESDINANAFFLDGATGNIGIGTGSPTNLLSVSGDANVTGTFTAATVNSSASNVTTTNSTTYSTSSGQGGISGFLVTNQLNNNNNIAQITFRQRNVSTYDTSIGASGGSASFLFFKNGGAERLRITSAGDLLFNQAASFIGTNTADGADSSALTLCGGGAASSLRGAYLNLIGNEHPSTGNVELSSGNVSGSYINIIGRASNSDIRFATGGTTERMRITSDGELLVGGTTAIGAAQGTMTIERLNGNPLLSLFRNDTSVASADIIGALSFAGNDTTSNTPKSLAAIYARASDTHAAGDNPTDLVFYTTPDGTEGIAEAGRITQAGSYVLKGGTTTAAAGVGIIFPATQVASADANSLDDYEEGTFTATLSSAGNTGATTITPYIGRYTKIGDTVTIWCQFDLDANMNDVDDYFTIGGLPFTATVYGSSRSAAIGSFRTGAYQLENRNAYGICTVFEGTTVVNVVTTVQGGGVQSGAATGSFAVTYAV